MKTCKHTNCELNIDHIDYTGQLWFSCSCNDCHTTLDVRGASQWKLNKEQLKLVAEEKIRHCQNQLDKAKKQLENLNQ